jgi:hypothetical protein
VRPRPEGFDYQQPDPEEERCPVCNPHGMCRTGNVPIAYVGTLTSSVYVQRCPANCFNGLKMPYATWDEDLTV